MSAAGSAADLTPMEPGEFDHEDTLLLDQIVIREKLPAQVLTAMGPIHAMVDMVALLDRNGIKFHRQDATVPTGGIPSSMLTTILKLPPGEPFVVPAGDDVWTINVLKARNLSK